MSARLPSALTLATLAALTLTLAGCASTPLESKPSPTLPDAPATEAPETAPAAEAPGVEPAPAPETSAPDPAVEAAPAGPDLDGDIPSLIAYLEQNPQGDDAAAVQQRLRERIGARLVAQAGGKGNVLSGEDFPAESFSVDDYVAGFKDVGVGFRLVGYIRGEKGRKTGYTYVDGLGAWQQLHATHVVDQASASSSRLNYDIRMLRIRRQVTSSLESGTRVTFYRDPAYTTQTVFRVGLTRYLKEGRPNGERVRLGGLGAAVLERGGRTTVYAFDLGGQSLLPR